MPAWFIVAPLKLVNLEAEWHVSQGCAVGMWVGGGSTGTMLAKLKPLAWQVAQPVVMPAWFMVASAKLPAVVWHSAQGWLVGM